MTTSQVSCRTKQFTPTLVFNMSWDSDNAKFSLFGTIASLYFIFNVGHTSNRLCSESGADTLECLCLHII